MERMSLPAGSDPLHGSRGWPCPILSGRPRKMRFKGLEIRPLLSLRPATRPEFADCGPAAPKPARTPPQNTTVACPRTAFLVYTGGAAIRVGKDS